MSLEKTTKARAREPNPQTRPPSEEIPSISRAAFIKSLEEAKKTAAQRLDGLVKDGGEDPVHYARTATRRLEARIDLLPKKVRRSPEVRKLLKRCDGVMKRTADLRDIDVIRGRVARYRKDPEKLLMLKKIDKRRKRLLKAAKRAAVEARDLRVPPETLVHVTQPGLQRRLEKVVGKLAEKIRELLPVIARDPKKLDELHRLRIDGKRLRYTLELVGDEKAPSLVRLRGWQDSLGSIHDLDVLASFLGEFRSPFAREVLRDALKEREREFKEFATSVLDGR